MDEMQVLDWTKDRDLHGPMKQFRFRLYSEFARFLNIAGKEAVRLPMDIEEYVRSRCGRLLVRIAVHGILSYLFARRFPSTSYVGFRSTAERAAEKTQTREEELRRAALQPQPTIVRRGRRRGKTQRVHAEAALHSCD